MEEHALIAPSSAAAIVACPARVLMCAGVGSHMDGDTTVREEGQAAHWVADGFCTEKRGPVHVGDVAPNGVAVTEHMLQTAQQWLAITQAWGVPVYYERKLVVPQVPRCFGTSDASGVDIARRVIRVADLKYGYRPIDPLCYQLACYAGSVAAYSGVPLDAGTTVHLTIYQPRAYHRAGPLRHATVTGQDVADMLATLADAAYRALAPEPEAVPGPQCTDCEGRARCGALRDAVHSFGLSVTGQDPLPPEFAEQELHYIQSKAELVNAYVSGLALELENHITRGYRPRLYELRRAAGALEWIPEKAAEARRVAEFMGHNINAPAALITPTQAREKIGPVVDMYARRGMAKAKLKLLPPPEKLFPQSR